MNEFIPFALGVIFGASVSTTFMVMILEHVYEKIEKEHENEKKS